MSKENRNYLSARGIVGIYLETSVDKQYQRTQRDKKRPYYKGQMIHAKCWKILASMQSVIRRNC